MVVVVAVVVAVSGGNGGLFWVQWYYFTEVLKFGQTSGTKIAGAYVVKGQAAFLEDLVPSSGRLGAQRVDESFGR